MAIQAKTFVILTVLAVSSLTQETRPSSPKPVLRDDRQPSQMPPMNDGRSGSQSGQRPQMNEGRDATSGESSEKPRRADGSGESSEDGDRPPRHDAHYEYQHEYDYYAMGYDYHDVEGNGRRPQHGRGHAYGHNHMGRMYEKKMGRSCQPGQVFCFEQMACIWPESPNGSNRRRISQLNFPDAIELEPVRECKPNEIYCIETGTCRLRSRKAVAYSGSVSTSNRSPMTPSSQTRRRLFVKVSAEAKFEVDFDTVVGDATKKETFKNNFKKNLALKVNIPEANIEITGMRKGSIIVEFTATQETNSSDSDQAAIDRFKEELAAGLEAMEVSNGQEVTFVSNYKMTDGSVSSSQNEGTTTAKSDDMADVLAENWIYIVIGVGSLIGVIALVIIIYCCCVKKNGQSKVVPLQNLSTNAKVTTMYSGYSQPGPVQSGKPQHHSPPPSYGAPGHQPPASAYPGNRYDGNATFADRNRPVSVPYANSQGIFSGGMAAPLTAQMADTFRPSASPHSRPITQTPRASLPGHPEEPEPSI